MAAGSHSSGGAASLHPMLRRTVEQAACKGLLAAHTSRARPDGGGPGSTSRKVSDETGMLLCVACCPVSLCSCRQEGVDTHPGPLSGARMVGVGSGGPLCGAGCWARASGRWVCTRIWSFRGFRAPARRRLQCRPMAACASENNPFAVGLLGWLHGMPRLAGLLAVRCPDSGPVPFGVLTWGVLHLVCAEGGCGIRPGMYSPSLGRMQGSMLDGLHWGGTCRGLCCGASGSAPGWSATCPAAGAAWCLDWRLKGVCVYLYVCVCVCVHAGSFVSAAVLQVQCCGARYVAECRKGECNCACGVCVASAACVARFSRTGWALSPTPMCMDIAEGLVWTDCIGSDTRV